MNSPLFIITSTIKPSDRPLSYINIRSVFSPEERWRQTLETIKSIKLRVPQAHIVVLENGLQDIAPIIPEGVAYHYYGHRFLIRVAADSKYKAVGEVVTLLAFLFFSRPPDGEYLIFKISGRYALTDSFSLDKWSCNYFTFRFYGTQVSTRCHAVPRKLIGVWVRALFFSFSGILCGQSIEDVLPKFLPARLVTRLGLLGIRGAIAPNGEIIIE